MTGDPERAEELAQELCALNRERQTVEGEIFQQCVQRLGRLPRPRPSCWLAGPGTKG